VRFSSNGSICNMLDFSDKIMHNTLTSSSIPITSWNKFFISAITFDYDAYSIESSNGLPNYFFITQDDSH